MIIWTVNDVIGVALLVTVIFGFMIVGMMYFIAIMINKFSKWREKRWERKYDRK